MNTISVLLDTDIGSDIDDAVALAYLLKQSRCELLGITTVSGQPEKRAMLADAICRAAGRTDIPIHVGIEAPMLVRPRQPRAPQAKVLTNAWPHRKFARENTAVRFLQQTIRSHPGEITLLAIGPLTNIALLFALDPEIPSLLKEMVIMGGYFFGQGKRSSIAEWNILCDPHAAEIVFRTPLLKLTAVGLDVTLKCVLPAKECRRRFIAAGGSLALVAAMAEVWFRKTPKITFHDPLAAALIFEPGLCKLEDGRIEAELSHPRHQGMTMLEPDTKMSLQHAAISVRIAEFFAHYFSITEADDPRHPQDRIFKYSGGSLRKQSDGIRSTSGEAGKTLV